MTTTMMDKDLYKSYMCYVLWIIKSG